MPEAFETCVSNGGKVYRMTGPSERFGLTKGQYRNICSINGETYQGHVHTKKKAKK